MKRSMIDIETMANSPGALIISIGGCKFDTDTGTISDELLLNIDFKETLKKYPGKFVINQETINWWKTQDPAVLESCMQNQIPLDEALDILYKWLVPSQELWCWGMSFDVPILEHAIRVTGKYVQYDNKLPWKYHLHRCARTTAKIFNMEIERDADAHHNALADCIDQSKLMMEILSA